MTSSPARRVLVVDDNQDSLETLAMLLKVKGHDARVAADGEQALSVADEYQPHVIMLDLSLPGMDGYEVARRLRERPYGGSLVLAALTGWSGKDVQTRAADAGFDFHLLKPVEWSHLEEVLAASPAVT